jgi:hypothetical protein
VYQRRVYGAHNAAVSLEEMHPATQRLYKVVQRLCKLEDLPQPSRVAHELNVSQQILKHWESRGPSARGLLDFQLSHSVNATWVLTGHGPQFIGTLPAVRAAEAAARYASVHLSAELLAALAKLPEAELRRIENSVRGQLDMPPLPRAGNRASA